jgi:hypothetical protein
MHQKSCGEERWTFPSNPPAFKKVVGSPRLNKQIGIVKINEFVVGKIGLGFKL